MINVSLICCLNFIFAGWSKLLLPSFKQTKIAVKNHTNKCTLFKHFFFFSSTKQTNHYAIFSPSLQHHHHHHLLLPLRDIANSHYCCLRGKQHLSSNHRKYIASIMLLLCESVLKIFLRLLGNLHRSLHPQKRHTSVSLRNYKFCTI